MTPDQAVFLRDLLVTRLGEEYENNRRMIAAIPDARPDYRPDPKARTAIELAWHIVLSELWCLDGVVNGAFTDEEPPHPSAKEADGILAFYERAFRERITKVKAVPAEKLVQTLSLHGKFANPAVMYLVFLSDHSIHHRGQLSTYLRPMGSKVPATYGSSADAELEEPAKT